MVLANTINVKYLWKSFKKTLFVVSENEFEAEKFEIFFVHVIETSVGKKKICK